jgi:hypothetical protein
MRVIFYLVVGVIILTLLRSVVEAVGKVFAGGSQASSASPPEQSRDRVSQSLKKDPVCGTFVSEATAMQKSKGGETYYFCSAACRDKF